MQISYVNQRKIVNYLDQCSLYDLAASGRLYFNTELSSSINEKVCVSIRLWQSQGRSALLHCGYTSGDTMSVLRACLIFGDSSGVYICKSEKNDLKHGNYI
jgi:hypothetical protein